MEMVHFIPPSQRRLALLAAQADTAPVLIFGASGTGKGAIARWIHANGPRASRVFLVANRQQPLLEQIQKAQGGTILISDIGSLTLGEQKLLLDFLNTKSIPHPEGGTMRMLVNARVMVASSQALEGRAQSGLFNGELLSKLNVFRLEMPTLSKRSEEFEDIVMGIMAETARELHKEYIRGLEPEAWQKLKSYDWPGNLRELRNVLKIAVVTANGDKLAEKDLPNFGYDRFDFRATREEFEKSYILELLKTFDWQIDRTCKMTRMDKAVLLNKMHQYGIDTSEVTVP